MDTKSGERLVRSLYEKLQEPEESNVQSTHTTNTRRIETANSDPHYKPICILIGDDNTGKSTLIATLANLPPPIPRQDGWGDMHTDVERHTIVVEMGDCKRVLSLWDTIGAGSYHRRRPHSCSEADVFLICFSIAKPASFESVKKTWYYELITWSNVANSVWVLLGLHADTRKSEHESSKELDGARNFVSREKAEKLAKNLGRWNKKNVPYVECDAREKGGLQAVIEAIAIANLERSKVKHNSRFGQSCTIL